MKTFFIIIILSSSVIATPTDETFSDANQDANSLSSNVAAFKDSYITFEQFEPEGPAFQLLGFVIPNVDGTPMNVYVPTQWADGPVGSVTNGIYKLKNASRLFMTFLLTIAFINRIYQTVRQW